VYSSAWKTARASGVLSSLSYDMLDLLSSIYEVQKLLEDVDARVSRILLQPQSVQKMRTKG
jgi:hypothetical protein